jgi:plastocyanin
MKYIFIALFLIIGGIIWSNMQSNGAVPITTVKEIPAPESVEKTPTQQEVSTEKKVDTTESVTSGNDVGMEFPETVITSPNANATKTFEISGTNFAFDVTQIKVKQGDSVTINFKSTDGFHAFVLDEFNARTERVKTGNTTSITFIANKKGTFEYYCSVGSHRVNGMVGKLVVE